MFKLLGLALVCVSDPFVSSNRFIQVSAGYDNRRRPPSECSRRDWRRCCPVRCVSEGRKHTLQGLVCPT